MRFLPELLLLGSGLIFFFLSLGKPSDQLLKRTANVISLIILLSTLACLGQEGSLFYDSYRVDLFSQFFKMLLAAATFFLLLVTKDLPGIKSSCKAEYYLFLFMSLLGLMMLVSSVELISIFVALELSSFAVYVMVPLRANTGEKILHSEAGIKYLLYGVMATGFLLFGMSYLYGLTGTTHLYGLAGSSHELGLVNQLTYMFNRPAAVVAMVMVMSGFFYKLALFPFHFWVPDVYEGSANETTAFIATVPKLAAVALLIRLVTMIHVDGQTIVNLLIICSLGSMFYGNLSALVQKDLKRLLAFSGIAHAGFVLFGLLTFQITGYSNAMYYIVGYVVMNLAIFMVICTVSQKGENLLIEDLKGLNTRSPLLALTLLVSLFSLAGIPPFIGFTGKFMLLIGALKQDSRFLIPVILAAFNTAIGIYYYLSVVRIAYCTDEENTKPIQTGFTVKALCLFFIVLIIYLGLIPSSLLDISQKAINVIL